MIIYEVAAKETTTVRNLKKKVINIVDNKSTEEVCLYIDGLPLKDEKRLIDCGISRLDATESSPVTIGLGYRMENGEFELSDSPRNTPDSPPATESTRTHNQQIHHSKLKTHKRDAPIYSPEDILSLLDTYNKRCL